MRFDKKLTTTALLGLTALAFTGSALADETFNFGNAGGTYHSLSGDYTVTAEAWSDTWDYYDPDRMESATLTHYSGGLGNVNQNGGETGSNGQHSVDNKPNDGWSKNQGDRDFILFEFFDKTTGFPQPVTLDTVKLGWLSRDSDLSILALTNPGGLDAILPDNLYGESIDDLTGAGGWTLFERVGTGESTAANKMRSVGAGITESSAWIVGTSFTNADGHFDKVKIHSLLAHIPDGGGPPTGVPLPASVFLMAAGIPLMRRFRRPSTA